MKHARHILVCALLLVAGARGVRAQVAQRGRTFYGVAAAASTVDLTNIGGLIVTASLGRQFDRWVGLQLDAFVGQVGLTPDQGFPTKGLRAADSLPTAPRATSTAGLTASGRLCLCSLPNPLLPSRTGAGGEIYVVGGAGAYYFSEHSTGNRSTRLGASAGLGAAVPLRAFGPFLFFEGRYHALDGAHAFEWLSLGIRWQ
jgi:hypothetical protein